MKNAASLLMAAGLAAAPAASAESPFFRMPVGPEAGQTALPTVNTDSRTGMAVTVPCAVCRVRANEQVGFQPSLAGSQGDVSWAVASGQTPPGVELSPATGRMTGAPSAVGSSTFILSATDSRGKPATSRRVTFQVLPPPSLAYPGSSGTSRRSVAIAPQPSALIGPASYAITAGTLPAGLTMDGASGVISGTVETTALGLRVTVTDADGALATSAPFDIVNTDQGTIAFASPAYSARTGVRLSVKPVIIGLKPDAGIAVASGTIPLGMSVVPSTGEIQGTPAVPGMSKDIVLSAQDVNDATVRSKPISITTMQPTLAYAAPRTRIGRPYAVVPTVTGLQAPTFGQVAGALPKGLALSSADGSISGTPSVPGSFPGIQVTGVDGDLAQATSDAFGIEVLDAFSIALAPGDVTQSARVGIPATGRAPSVGSASGPASIALGAVTGTAPSGARVDASGVMTYTATAAGKWTYALNATDPDGSVATSDVATVTVVAPLQASAPDVSARSGGTGRTTLAATPSTSTTWALAPGTPSWITLSGAVVTAAPAAALAPATYGPYTARGTDADGSSAPAPFSVKVSPALAVAQAKDIPGQAGIALTGTPPSVTGTVGTLAYVLLNGGSDVSQSLAALCPGLSFATGTGIVSGTPTGPCSANLDYRVTDDGAGTPDLAATATTPAPFRLAVEAATVTASSPDVTVTEGDVVSVSASTSLPNPTWSVAGQPAWMTFSKTGATYATSSVSADVTSTQTYRVVLTATGGGASATKTVNVTVNPAAVTMASPAPVRSGGAFSADVGKTLAAPGAWTASASPADVAGLAVSGTTLTGRAPANATSGAFTRSLTVAYTASAAPVSANPADMAATASAGATLTVHPALAIADQTAMAGSAGTALSFAAPAVSGKVGTLTYALLQGATDISGSLGSVCPGLSFNAATGAVTGNPSAGCSANLSYRVSDDGGNVPTLVATATDAPFALNVTPATATASVPSVSVTEGDTVAFSATTTLPSPTWSVAGNPAWMTFTASGGTYATSGVSADIASTQTYTVVMTASNASGATAPATVTVTVSPSTVTVPAVSARSGKAFTAQIVKTLNAAGAASVTASPSDVAGLAVSGTTLNGTAPVYTGSGTTTRSITVVNTASAAPSNGPRATATGSGTLTVYPGISVNEPVAQNGSKGLQMSFNPPAVTNAVGTTTYALTQAGADVSGTLDSICAGLTFSTATGVVSGIPTNTCTATLGYTATDNGGGDPNLATSAASPTFALNVGANFVTASTNYVTYVEGDYADFYAYAQTAQVTWQEIGKPDWMNFRASMYGRDDPNNSFAADVTSPQTWNITMKATDYRTGQTGSATVVMTVVPASTTLTPASVRTGGGFSMTASSTMRASAAWSAAGDADVTGLAFSGATLSGTAPANAGPSAITRTVTATRRATTPPITGSQYSAVASGSATLTVYPALSVANQSARSGKVGTSLSVPAPVVTGQAGALTYALLRGGSDVSGSLNATCPGLAFSTADGSISGTPTASCSTPLDYRVTDNGGGNAGLAATATDTAAFTLSVSP